DAYAPQAWAACLADRIGSLGPLAVLAAATDRGNEILAHAAARSGLPMAANCIRVDPGERGDPADPSTPWTLTRLQWGGSLLEELADLLGGAVGCSRVVTSLAWRPHADQVGQTGTRIAPDLYIACGISGAIQHMVGCKGAKHLLAINTDPDAPIMAKAEYAVI